MKSVLVTGCNGTVGRYVTRALLGTGYRVIGLSLEPVPHVPHERFDYQCIDLTDSSAVAELVTRERPDALVHLAALVHVRSAQLGFLDYCRLNYDASKRLFEVAANSSTKKIVFSSTIEVYGPTPDGVTIDEAYSCRPDSDYARTKLLAEAALTEIGAAHGIAAVALRFAPVYAPDFRLNLDKRLYLAKRVTYTLGPANYSLSLCSVRNIEHFILRWLAHENSVSGVFNLCDARSYGISELLARESRVGGPRLQLRIPFWPAVAAGAAFETSMNLLGRSAGMYTANNIRKLVRSAHWDTSKAASAVGPLPFDIDNTLDQML